MEEEIRKKQELERLKDKYNRIAILYPCYKMIPAKPAMDLMVTYAQMLKAGFDMNLFCLDQTSICLARNQLVNHFLDAHEKKAYDLVLWLDSDQTFDMGDVMDLMYHLDENQEIDMISGRYISRDNVNPKVCAFVRKKELNLEAISPASKGIVEIDACGFGFFLMKPKVLEDMYSHFGLHQFQFMIEGPKELGGFFGEDIFWCLKAKEIGYKVYVDNDVNIGHYGGIIDDNFMFVSMYKVGKQKK